MKKINEKIALLITSTLILPKKKNKNGAEGEKLNDVAEKRKDRIACFSFLSCVIIASFGLQWQRFLSPALYSVPI